MNMSAITLILSTICTVNAMQLILNLPTGSELHQAIQTGNINEALRILTNLESKTNELLARNLLLQVNQNNQTALHLAIERGHTKCAIAICKLAIRHHCFKALYNAQDLDNKKAIDCALTKKNFVVKVVLTSFLAFTKRNESHYYEQSSTSHL